MNHDEKDESSEEEESIASITPEHSCDILCRHNGREEPSEEEESIEEEEIVSFRKFGITLEHSRDTLWWWRMHQYENEESSEEEESISSW